MAPKKGSPNGFMIFTFDWKSKYGKQMTVREATDQAGKIWATMTANERAPYNERSKQNKVGNNRAQKFTCTGTPLAVVEKEKQDAENRERQMKRNIETTVRNSVKKCELENQNYFFVMVNYFTKTLKGGVYVPAEISLCEYSLKQGVSRKYHSFINPGVNIYGHQYEAQHHADSTHKLPLPPKAMGETNLASIYNHLLEFVRNKETGEYPPLYTLRDNIPVVESVLDFLKTDTGADDVNLKIYSIQYLFYILKEATCEMGEVDKPKSFYITDAYFERDFFEYQSGIACQYHEEIDKSKYCTDSCVTRWGFMFSDYMCRDIAISLKPGRHVPQSTNLAAIINPAPNSTHDDNASYHSLNTDTSYATNAISENKIYYDNQRTTFSQASRSLNITSVSKRFSDDDFPDCSLSSRTPKKQATKMELASTSGISKTKDYKKDHKVLNKDLEDAYDDGGDLNPWARRSRRVPNKPETSDFNIDYTRGDDGDLSDGDDYDSVISFGRGRGMINRSLNKARPSGSGRGHIFLP